MKSISFTIAMVLSTSSLAASAPSFLPVPKYFGPAKTPVAYTASKPKKIKQITGSTLYSLDVALKWGTSIYEYGEFQFVCENVRKNCVVSFFQSRGSFQKCSSQSGRIVCTNPLNYGDYGSPESDPHAEPVPPFAEGRDSRENDSQFEEDQSSNRDDQDSHIDDRNMGDPARETGDSSIDGYGSQVDGYN